MKKAQMIETAISCSHLNHQSEAPFVYVIDEDFDSNQRLMCQQCFNQMREPLTTINPQYTQRRIQEYCDLVYQNISSIIGWIQQSDQLILSHDKPTLLKKSSDFFEFKLEYNKDLELIEKNNSQYSFNVEIEKVRQGLFQTDDFDQVFKKCYINKINMEIQKIQTCQQIYHFQLNSITEEKIAEEIIKPLEKIFYSNVIVKFGELQNKTSDICIIDNDDDSVITAMLFFKLSNLITQKIRMILDIFGKQIYLIKQQSILHITDKTNETKIKTREQKQIQLLVEQFHTSCLKIFEDFLKMSDYFEKSCVNLGRIINRQKHQTIQEKQEKYKVNLKSKSKCLIDINLAQNDRKKGPLDSIQNYDKMKSQLNNDKRIEFKILNIVYSYVSFINKKNKDLDIIFLIKKTTNFIKNYEIENKVKIDLDQLGQFLASLQINYRIIEDQIDLETILKLKK